MNTFVEEKVARLSQYDRDENKALELEEDFENGKMTREQFITALAAFDGSWLFTHFHFLDA